MGKIIKWENVNSSTAYETDDVIDRIIPLLDFFKISDFPLNMESRSDPDRKILQITFERASEYE